MITQSELSQALTGVAQGAINISEGLTTIEKGSRVCQGMETLAISHRLIEAAPEMLEALKVARDMIEEFYTLEKPHPRNCFCLQDRCPRLQVDRAIAKATGKEEGR